MNPRGLLLVATLTANCGLAALLLRSPGTAPPAAPPTEASSAAPKPKAADTQVKSAAARADAPAPPTALPNFHWGSLESEDFKQYIQNLRGFGVPEEIIRDLIRAEVTKLYRPKLRALRPATSPEKYWERNYGGSFSQQTAEQRQQQTALYKEQAELLKSLLGETPVSSEHPLTRAFPNLAPEVLKQVTELQSKFGEKRQELYAKSAYQMDGTAMTEQRKLERDFHDELAKLTSPEQALAYKLRNSDVSRNLREELRAFAPSEEEFKAIFNAKEAAEAARPVSSVTGAQVREAQTKTEAAMVEALGPERAKEYKLLQDYGFRSLAEAGVAKESLLRIAEMKTAAETASRSLQRDPALTAEQRSAALLAIRTETEKELATLLGERRAKAYPTSGGYWIRNLAPTITTTRTVAP